MSAFTEDAWQRTAALRTAIDRLPFNRELADGTLDRNQFGFYITQDALYLEQYARVLTIAGARAPDGKTLRLFAESALEAIAVEQALHATYFKTYAIDPSAAEASPDCLSYTSFLLATAYHDPWEILLAALLPCFWIYWDVGTAIARKSLGTNKSNPYQAWIDTYADTAFGNAVRAVIEATDQAASATSPAIRQGMMRAFVASTRYEYLFWDGAYQGRGWPAG